MIGSAQSQLLASSARRSGWPRACGQASGPKFGAGRRVEDVGGVYLAVNSSKVSSSWPERRATVLLKLRVELRKKPGAMAPGATGRYARKKVFEGAARAATRMMEEDDMAWARRLLGSERARSGRGVDRGTSATRSVGGGGGGDVVRMGVVGS